MNDGSEIDVLMMPYHEISLDPLERWLNALWLGYMYYGGLTEGGRGRPPNADT